MDFRGEIEWETRKEKKRKDRTVSGKVNELRNRLHAQLSLRQRGIPAPVATTLSKLSIMTHNATHASPPNVRPSYFRSMDLPDELQLKILSYSFEGRISEIKEPMGSDKIKHRHSPHHISYYSPPIALAQVSRKLRAMTFEFHPECFTFTCGWPGRYPIRFNVDTNVLVLPQVSIHL
jgi:hypothetical protein